MSQVKLGEQPVNEEVRDNFFKEIRHKNNNNICLDCQKKNPKWASIHLGIHLCIDCAGKHRQYGVIYSFVKSTNLDVWNQKQLLFMQKGGNERAIQYFRKCGIVSNNNKHIDYKSPVVQKYKTILTQEVQSELTGEPIKKIEKIEKKQQMKESVASGLQSVIETKQIPHAEQVNQAQKPKQKKDKKKKMGNQIIIQNFEELVFDDGVSKQQKEKIVKQYQKQDPKQKQVKQLNNTQEETTHLHQETQKVVQPPKPQIKQLTEEQSIKKLQELKSKNLKQISSEEFKDTSMDNVTLKQKLNTFSGATSISSSSFNNQPEENPNQAIQKVKSFVTNTGGKLFSTLSSYWSK